MRIDEFMAAYGIRGGTMTGLLRYDLDMRYGGGRLGADGRLGVPEGGTVTIELLDRLLSWAAADPTGVVKTRPRQPPGLRLQGGRCERAHGPNDGIQVTLSLKGREVLGIFPPRVKEINVIGMPIGFLAQAVPWPMRSPARSDRRGERTMNWRRGARAVALAALAIALAACVPVTVNVTFPQEKLDSAARQIEEMPAQPAGASTPPPAPRPRAEAGASTWRRRPGSTNGRPRS